MPRAIRKTSYRIPEILVLTISGSTRKDASIALLNTWFLCIGVFWFLVGYQINLLTFSKLPLIHLGKVPAIEVRLYDAKWNPSLELVCGGSTSFGQILWPDTLHRFPESGNYKSREHLGRLNYQVFPILQSSHFHSHPFTISSSLHTVCTQCSDKTRYPKPHL